MAIRSCSFCRGIREGGRERERWREKERERGEGGRERWGGVGWFIIATGLHMISYIIMKKVVD